MICLWYFRSLKALYLKYNEDILIFRIAKILYFLKTSVAANDRKWHDFIKVMDEVFSKRREKSIRNVSTRLKTSAAYLLDNNFTVVFLR